MLGCLNTERTAGGEGRLVPGSAVPAQHQHQHQHNNTTTQGLNVDIKLIAITIGLLVQAGGIVWWSAGLQSEVRHNDYKIQMMQPDLEEAISFTKLWPAGKWGSGELPSDTRQDLKIAALEKQVDQLMSKIYLINGNK